MLENYQRVRGAVPVGRSDTATNERPNEHPETISEQTDIASHDGPVGGVSALSNESNEAQLRETHVNAHAPLIALNHVRDRA